MDAKDYQNFFYVSKFKAKFCTKPHAAYLFFFQINF